MAFAEGQVDAGLKLPQPAALTLELSNHPALESLRISTRW